MSHSLDISLGATSAGVSRGKEKLPTLVVRAGRRFDVAIWKMPFDALTSENLMIVAAAKRVLAPKRRLRGLSRPIQNIGP